MKKILFVVAALMPLVSCMKEQEHKNVWELDRNEGTGIVSIKVEGLSNEGGKYIEPYLDALTYESHAISIKAIVYDHNTGNFVTSTVSDGLEDLKMVVPVGEYDVLTFINLPDREPGNISEFSEYGKADVDLSWYSIKDSSFPMHGKGYCEVFEDARCECKIKAKRYASRIALKSLQFDLPQGYVLKGINCAFLSNVNGRVCGDGKEENVNFKFGGEIPVWYNMDGKNHSSEFSEGTNGRLVFASQQRAPISRTSPAELPELTYFQPDDSGWKDISNGGTYTFKKDNHPALFYCLPNTSEGMPGPMDYWLRKPTAVTISCKIQTPDSKIGDYYYTIPVYYVQENMSYTLVVNLKSLGTTDPGQPVVKGTVDPHVSVEGWYEGDELEEII